MKLAAGLIGLAMALIAAGCGQSVQSVSSQTESGQAQLAQPTSINWQTLGCAEPAPLVVASSDALETDVGLAAGSLADTYGVGLDEAKRRLRLQEPLGQAMAAIRSAEGGRVARSELQHQPTFAGVVTLTGADVVSAETRDILCNTPELEVRLGAVFTEQELVNETQRLAGLIVESNPGLTSFGPSDGELRFDVIDDPARDRLDAILAELTDYPYSISSLGLPPLVLDPTLPFPLLDTTGRGSSGVGLSGTLLIEGPCAYLNETLLVLPARETTWNATTGVLNTGSGDLRSGDAVTGGGSRYTGALADLDQSPDPSCRVDGDVYVASFAPVDPSATAAPGPPTALPLPPGAASAGAPPEPPDAPRFELEPRSPQPGQAFTATFDDDSSRGGFFLLRRWLGNDWSLPRFMLESDAIRPASAIEVPGDEEGPMMEDYGVSGAGPDQLMLPLDIEPGHWRLCTANAATQQCTQFTVTG